MSSIISTEFVGKPLHFLQKQSFRLKRDLTNKLKYGLSAPKYQERIWVNPQRITHFVDREEIRRVTGGLNRNQASGYVINWNEIQDTKPVMDDFRMEYCFKHWKEGYSWKDLGVYDFMLQTKKYHTWSREEIIARFLMLDQAFEEVKKSGRLKTRKEINPSNFREKDGILIHIGKDGIPYFGGNGYHRLAMSFILNLKLIPACIGVVDKDSIHTLDNYRHQK